MATGKDWDRLAEFARERRVELGMTQEDVRGAGGPSTATVRLIEGALQQGYQPATLRDLEKALQWERGSVARILAGGNPAPVQSLPRISPRLQKGMSGHLDEINRLIDDASRDTPADQLTGAMLFPDSRADRQSWDQLRGFGYPVSQVAQFIAIMRTDEDEGARNHQDSAAGLPAPGHFAVTMRA